MRGYKGCVKWDTRQPYSPGKLKWLQKRKQKTFNSCCFYPRRFGRDGIYVCIKLKDQRDLERLYTFFDFIHFDFLIRVVLCIPKDGWICLDSVNQISQMSMFQFVEFSIVPHRIVNPYGPN